ncbi:nitrous oxide reductase accessory protein NosL [Tabrizicola soli]|uniref:Nitrous oxide reductase accessory protein NosL n=1 Tax=Tabrizicola soli TaxID=2185115 RepID=A0ABV7DRQ7_9RHOB|nr:nitrous oxide reductase accessory protein NosL [Tabrizicola soli]
MKRALLFVLALAACQDEVAQNTDPLALTPETIGHFCQMNLLEHEGPKGQVHLEGLPGAPLFFSQVSDTVAYLRLPEQTHKVLAIYVSDMGAEGATWQEPGAANWIDATTAHYVVGGDLPGGMGAPEIAPFAELADAQAFAAEHGGNVMGLKDIPDSAVIAPMPEAGGDDDYSRRLKALSDKTGG